MCCVIVCIPVGKKYFAFIDKEDVKKVCGYKWYVLQAQNTRYAVSYGNGESGSSRRVSMHRLIMGEPSGMQIDHKDMNGLNNTRSNLRICNKSENMCNRGLQVNNSSGYKGVSWNKNAGKWECYIKKDKKRQYLGLFDCPKKAYSEYFRVAKYLHGEFAKL